MSEKEKHKLAGTHLPSFLFPIVKYLDLQKKKKKKKKKKREIKQNTCGKGNLW